jgi:transcriptional regulator with XRE-family HTH domain
MNKTEKIALQGNIGARICMAREIAGLSQLELAERIGIGRTQITNIEAGRSDTGATMIIQIARAIGIKPGRLLPDR